MKEDIDNGEVELLEPYSQSIFGDDLSGLMKSAKLAGKVVSVTICVFHCSVRN